MFANVKFYLINSILIKKDIDTIKNNKLYHN